MVRTLVVLVVAFASAACTRTIWRPDARRLCHGRVCYEVGALSRDWRVVHTEGAEIGFYNDALKGVIQANATCRDDAEASPLASLADQLLIGYTERQIRSRSTVKLAGREALRTVATAKLDGVPISLDFYVLKRNGCIFDLSYAAPPFDFPRGEGDFALFVRGFTDAREHVEARR